MSEDVSHELQVAIINRLKGDAAVTSLLAGGIHDRVPKGVILPYASFGPEQEIPEDSDCLRASEIFLQIDVWSDDPGFREVRRISRAIEDALHDASITLDENALVYLAFDGRRVLRDRDGLTSHAVLTFRAGVEKY